MALTLVLESGEREAVTAEFRLRTGYSADRMLVDAYGANTARAWFLGSGFDMTFRARRSRGGPSATSTVRDTATSRGIALPHPLVTDA